MDSDAVLQNQVGISPYGEADEIGRLNMMTAESRARILARADASRIFDLGVEYFLGMPSWALAKDPPYQIYMPHTPSGTAVDLLNGQSSEMNQRIGYSGDIIAMYTHCGTHIDTLNHFGYGDKIWNNFTASEHLGSRHWIKCGAEKMPPIIARGVLLDVAAVHGVDLLPNSYPITPEDLQEAARREGIEVQEGDVVLVHSGRMTLWDQPERFLMNAAGLNPQAARWLVEQGAMVVGVDQATIDYQPAPETPGHYLPVHLYLLSEQGVPILEVVPTQELAREQVYEFAFFGGAIRLRGSTGSPIRPWALPLRP